jgi:hypothetical protein
LKCQLENCTCIVLVELVADATGTYRLNTPREEEKVEVEVLMNMELELKNLQK